VAFSGSVAVLPNVSEGTPDALVKQRLLHKDITKFWGGNQGLICLLLFFSLSERSEERKE
jgi:hypothetical protein|tara:strand:+ start:362 stop:541 length:180 start_codon:yes stop_codon:yes gene_type:complete